MFQKIKTKVFLILIIVLVSPSIVFAYSIKTVDNATGSGIFTVSPGKVELSVEKGETLTKNIKVLNLKGEKTKFRITKEDIGPNPEDGSGKLYGENLGPYSLKQYLSFDEEYFTLKDKEEAEIPVKVSIPSNAPPGGLYGSILVSDVGESDSKGQSNVSLSSRIGVSFFVKINGQVKESGQLASFTTDKKVFFSYPINLNYNYKNDGNIYLNPYGFINVKKYSGQDLGNIEIKPYYTFPDSKRKMSVTIGSELSFGHYKATIQLNRGYGNVIDTKELSFWFIPYQPLLLAVLLITLVIIVLLIIIFRNKKIINKRRKDK